MATIADWKVELFARTANILRKMPNLTSLSLEGLPPWVLDGCKFKLEYFYTDMRCGESLNLFLLEQCNIGELVLVNTGEHEFPGHCPLSDLCAPNAIMVSADAVCCAQLVAQHNVISSVVSTTEDLDEYIEAFMQSNGPLTHLVVWMLPSDDDVLPRIAETLPQLDGIELQINHNSKSVSRCDPPRLDHPPFWSEVLTLPHAPT